MTSYCAAKIKLFGFAILRLLDGFLLHFFISRNIEIPRPIFINIGFTMECHLIKIRKPVEAPKTNVFMQEINPRILHFTN